MAYFNKIKTKFQLLIFIAIIPLVIAIIYSNYRYRAHLESEIKNNVISLSGLTANGLKKYINSIEQMLITISQAKEIQEGNQTEIVDFFKKLHKRHPDVANFGLNDLNGNILISSFDAKFNFYNS